MSASSKHAKRLRTDLKHILHELRKTIALGRVRHQTPRSLARYTAQAAHQATQALAVSDLEHLAGLDATARRQFWDGFKHIENLIEMSDRGCAGLRAIIADRCQRDELSLVTYTHGIASPVLIGEARP